VPLVAGSAIDTRPSGSCRAAHQIAQTIDRIQQIAGLLVDRQSRWRRNDARRCADQQLLADRLFQVRHLTAQRGLRHVQDRRRRRKAPLLDHAHEVAHLAQRDESFQRGHA
jgi:hypothetical protein